MQPRLKSPKLELAAASMRAFAFAFACATYCLMIIAVELVANQYVSKYQKWKCLQLSKVTSRSASTSSTRLNARGRWNSADHECDRCGCLVGLRGGMWSGRRLVRAGALAVCLLSDSLASLPALTSRQRS